MDLVELIMKYWPMHPQVAIWLSGGTVVVGFATLIVLAGRVKISLRNRAGREKAIADPDAIERWEERT